MTNKKEVDNFEGMEEQKVIYKNLKFGEVGDWFKGVLIDNSRKLPNQLSQRKEMQTIFVFKAKGGSFHNVIDRKIQNEATIVKDGEEWSYITGKSALLKQLERAQLGQIVGLRFAETVKASTPGYADAHIVKVYLGEQDPDYKGEEGLDDF